jgi:hypothetical protein
MRERGRERKRELVHVCVREKDEHREMNINMARGREGERVRECVRERVTEMEMERESVYFCVRE